ncbi:MAG: carbonate dehydratase [Desulfobacter sp.]
MRILKNLFDNNKRWADELKQRDPDFFAKQSELQNPDYLWIGCSDSRVPASEIIGLLPGDLFVHRNIANLVIHTDMNCLSVLQYAVYVLRVKHIIVCGHYGCGGVRAALGDDEFGLIDNWLLNIRHVYDRYKADLDRITDTREKVNRMCELNVVEQVRNVCQTTIVQRAWKSGQKLAVHGWIYNIGDGMLTDLDVCIASPGDFARVPLFGT